MKKDASFYWTLFLSTFTLSAFTFGGGYVIVPLMQKRFVKELEWITEEEMLDLVAIAQSSPGPIAVNASIIIGYRMAGIRGALLSVLGTSIPPLVIITIVSYFYLAFRDNAIVNAVLFGMQAGVAAVIVNVVIDMVKGITKNKKILPIIVMILAFLAAAFTSINIVVILFICGAIGAYTTYRESHVTKGGLNR
ncbi:MAG: chromate transporter [Carnobacterium sp.]|uniref:chromate transporter n=1 Tax=Carnobacterium sp. TaxID=48221 RepID=UPI003314A107